MNVPTTPVDFGAEINVFDDYQEDDRCPACGRYNDRHSATQLNHCASFHPLRRLT